MTKEEIKNVLRKSIIIGFGILAYSSIMTIFFADVTYDIHQMLFDISRVQFNAIVYAFIGLFKLFWMVLFVIPYIAILWSEKK
tara:strand:- start:86 stop:334 length:249 start_codon:yes stop_codon:yes gene_type:complete